MGISAGFRVTGCLTMRILLTVATEAEVDGSYGIRLDRLDFAYVV